MNAFASLLTVLAPFGALTIFALFIPAFYNRGRFDVKKNDSSRRFSARDASLNRGRCVTS